jgi:hypothetical protein
MSSSRHPETYGMTERVNIIFQQFLRYFGYYDVASSGIRVQRHSCARNKARSEANFSFSPKDHRDLLLSMRLSIHVSQDD